MVGRSQHDGLGGDPSPATARTVLGAIRAALGVLDGSEELEGRTVGVVGLGKVGAQLAGWLLEAGARVIGCDPLLATLWRLEEAGVEPVTSVDELLSHELDVLAPCAVGGMIDEAVAALVRCRVVCGAANNPLSGEPAARVLDGREILYVPDFLANCGGLIHADGERRGDGDPAQLERALDDAQARTRTVLLAARESGRLPGVVAEEHAWARIRCAAAGSFAGATA